MKLSRKAKSMLLDPHIPTNSVQSLYHLRLAIMVRISANDGDYYCITD